MKKTKLKILFVCIRNIFRSPTAECVFRKKANGLNLFENLEIDSAGTYKRVSQ
jgi:protein-tyrosine phosphatase